MDRPDWIAACAHQLQKRWRTVDPETLEEVAADLWADPTAQDLPPTQVAQDWLRPLEDPEPPRTLRSPWPSNGILGKVSVEALSAGIKLPPEPTKAHSGQPQTVVVDSAHLGRVRVRYTLHEARHRGKSSHCFWCAEYAERAA